MLRTLKLKNALAGFLQGCTPQPRPGELQEWRYGMFKVVSDDYDRNFDGNSPRTGVLVRSEVGVAVDHG